MPFLQRDKNNTTRKNRSHEDDNSNHWCPSLVCDCVCVCVVNDTPSNATEKKKSCLRVDVQKRCVRRGENAKKEKGHGAASMCKATVGLFNKVETKTTYAPPEVWKSKGNRGWEPNLSLKSTQLTQPCLETTMLMATD